MALRTPTALGQYTPAVERPPEAAHAHVLALDGVRGLAILAVLLYHGVDAPLTGQSLVGRGVFAVAEYGWIGVDLFFVLSGYLITGILLGARDRVQRGGTTGGYFGTFYWRRTLRIFPLYYALLVGAFVIAPHVALVQTESLARAQQHQAWYWLYVTNWPMAFGHLDWIPFPTAHLWSLAIEEQFYLVWPAVVLLSRTDRRLARVCGVGIVTAILYRIGVSYDGAYFATVSRMDALLIGGLCAIAVRHRLATPRHAVLLIAAGLVGLLLLRLPVVQPIIRVPRFTINAILGAGLVLSAALGMGRRLWEAGWLRWLGRYSYGLYVIHLFVMSRLDAVFPQRPDRALAWLALYAGISGGLAVVSFHVYEAPFLRLKRRVGQSVRGRHQADLKL